MASFDRPPRLSDNATEAILELIRSGTYQVGDALPGQRELSEQLKMSRTAIREGVRYLEAIGVLETRSGSGTYVIGVPPTEADEFSVDRWLQDHKDAVVDILEVREALETKATALAASRCTPELLATLAEQLARMESAHAVGDLTTLVEADGLFHEAIADASQNPFLAMLCRRVIRTVLPSRRSIFSIPGQPEKSLHEHRQIVAALQGSNADYARQLMLMHLQGAKDEILQLRAK